MSAPAVAMTEKPEGQIPRLQNKLSASLNKILDEIAGLEADLVNFLSSPDVVGEEKGKEPVPSLCTAADYLFDKTSLVIEASIRLRKISKGIQL